MHRSPVRVFALVAVTALVLGACSKTTTTTPTATKITVRAGQNDPKDPNVAVLAFLPASITVATAASVDFAFAGPEPHSVSFFPAGVMPPTPDKASAMFPPNGDTATFDGTAEANSGLRPQGAPANPFTVTFPKAGDFEYHCLIHPLMHGMVKVVDSGTTDTASEVTTRGDTELAPFLAEGEAAKAQLLAAAPTKKTVGGHTTWTVIMGASTMHTDVLAFAPMDAAIKAGDTVLFQNDSTAPHTATFASDGKFPQNPEDPAVQAPTSKSPITLALTGAFNSGLLPPAAPPTSPPPLVARQFSFVVPAAGTYKYICVFHVPSGMAGSIVAS